MTVASDWASRFYKTSAQYTKRDLEELQKKDKEIRTLRDTISVKEQIIHEQEMTQIKTNNVLERCVNHVDNDALTISKMANENDLYKRLYKEIQVENPKLLEESKVSILKIDYQTENPIKSAGELYKAPEYDVRKAEEEYLAKKKK